MISANMVGRDAIMTQYQQPYDSSIKSLLEGSAAEMLPYLLPGAEFVEERNVEVLKPPLRTDRVYLIRYREHLHILHLELETGADSDMDIRLLVYHVLLFEKYRLPVISIIVYPFRTSIAESPLREMSREDVLLTFNFRTLELWKLDARRYVEEHALSMYALLPTMQGADASFLLHAIDELTEHLSGTTLARQLLWMGTFLQRTEMVSLRDKQRVEERLKMFDSLLEQNPYVQELKNRVAAEAEAKGKAEGIAEGKAEGEAEGEVKGLQVAVIEIVRRRFPSLLDIAQQRVERVKKPDALSQFVGQISTAPDEATAAWLITTLAA
jgi:predicted transposase YdaD